MKRILFLALITMTAVLLTACGGKKAKGPSDLLVGTWVSSEGLNQDVGGIEISMSNVVVTYKKNNTSSGSMSMKMSGAGLPSAIDMDIKTTMTWSLSEDGKRLTETVTDGSAEITSDLPGLDAIADGTAEQMKAQGPQISEIVTLDKNTLTIKSAELDTTMTFTRK